MNHKASTLANHRDLHEHKAFRKVFSMRRLSSDKDQRSSPAERSSFISMLLLYRRDKLTFDCRMIACQIGGYCTRYGTLVPGARVS